MSSIFRLRIRNMRLILLALLACLVMGFTITAYAQDEYRDPVMEAARNAGLVTDIGISKTIGDATVTLDWAYADTQSLMVGYTLKTANGVKPEQLLPPFNAPDLSDDKGASFSYSNTQPTTDHQSNETNFVVQYYTQGVTHLDGNNNPIINNDYFNPPPDKLNLIFTLKLGDFSPSQGMFRNSSDPKPADYIEPIGPFAFNFTIPLYPPIIIQQAQKIQLKGVTMTLQKVTVTPTKTTARVCYNMPSAQDWIPDGSVSSGGTVGNLVGIDIVGTKETELNNAKNRCRDLSFYMFHDTKPATLNISIDNLATSLGEGPEDWNKIKAELAKHNIKIDVISGDHSLDVKVISVPDGIDYDQAVIEAREALGNLLQGPWTFKVDLP